jgi:hypothetical protein
MGRLLKLPVTHGPVIHLVSCLGGPCTAHASMSDQNGESHFEDVEIGFSPENFAPPAPPVDVSSQTRNLITSDILPSFRQSQ